jgi:hypothetical protein
MIILDDNIVDSNNMIKFAYNFCCGLYDFSDEAIKMYNKLAEREGVPWYTKIETDGTRDPIYIKVIEELKHEAMIHRCCPDIFEIDPEEIIKEELDINAIDDYGILYQILNDNICHHSSNESEENASSNESKEDGSSNESEENASSNESKEDGSSNASEEDGSSTDSLDHGSSNASEEDGSSTDSLDDSRYGQSLDDNNSPSWFLTPYRRKNPPQVVINNTSNDESSLVITGTPLILTEKPTRIRNISPNAI